MSSRRGSLVQMGGGLGIAAVLLGFTIFLSDCGGIDAALKLSMLPVLLGGVGFVISIVGAITQKNHPAVESTHALAGMMLGLMGVIGGLLEMSAWLGWQLLPK